jgi:UDP-glucose 4-epimerase
LAAGSKYEIALGMRSLVIGGAGFIGSHLVDRLVQLGPVCVFDNLSVGKREYIQEHLNSGQASLVVGDARNLNQLRQTAALGHDVIYHLAANPEARWGLENTKLDLEVGTIATYNALEAARLEQIPRFVLASSGTVYGETTHNCSEQDLGCLPISLYGASKLASESLLSAFVSCFDLQGNIFRFGNVVGPRGTHGAALDFLHKLQQNPKELEVLGDGSQSKPYLYVTDCVSGILHGVQHSTEALTICNIAPDSATSVRQIAAWCVRYSPYPQAAIRYTGGDRGWRGDVPFSRLDSSKLCNMGFQFTYTSDQAVEQAVRALAIQVFPENIPTENER